MNYQLVLIGLVVLCVLLFMVQWFRQVRHALRGATRPLRTHAFFNWCLLIVAVLAGAGASTNIKTEAATSRQVAESSSAKTQRAKQSSSSQAEKSKAVAVNNSRQGSQDQSKPAPLEKQQLKLDQNGHAALNNFPVPAKTSSRLLMRLLGMSCRRSPASLMRGRSTTPLTRRVTTT